MIAKGSFGTVYLGELGVSALAVGHLFVHTAVLTAHKAERACHEMSMRLTREELRLQ